MKRAGDFLQHISIQQLLKQAMQFFAESVCRDEAVLDLRLSTTKRLMGSACLQAWRHEHLNVTLFSKFSNESIEDHAWLRSLARALSCRGARCCFDGIESPTVILRVF